MTQISLDQMYAVTITALQTIINSYPIYNHLTQHQNSLRQLIIEKSNNPLLRKGEKYFSQNDEDGITLEILSRMNLLNNRKGTFIEFGVGNGTENNSLILLMHGYRGVWIGNEDLIFDTTQSSKLLYIKDWITLNNIPEKIIASESFLNTKDIDVLSMDLDGNDLFFLNSILESQVFPKLIITEYNAKFPPPVEFTISYDEGHVFNSDYMGASLQSINKLLSNKYTLVACNVTGSNAFFIRNDYRNCFRDIPSEISNLFMPANYGIVTRVGHNVSPNTIIKFI